MQYFVNVLTDTCEIKNNTYVIHTLIHQFTYRIEVFKNGKLIDTGEAKSPEPIDTIFLTFYKKAHQAMRMKYCTCSKDDVLSYEKKTTTLLSKQKPEKKHTQKNTIKIAIISIIVVLFLLYIYTSFFIYSQIYINTFYTNPKEKIVYLEKIENKTHLLSKRCLDLSKKERLEENIFTLDQCEIWCHKHVIQKEMCTLFFSYKARNYYASKKTIVQEKNTTTPSNLSLNYTVLPQKDLLLSNHKDVILQINNLNSFALNIYVKKIVLQQSNDEEIVQFRDAISKLQLHANEAKRFIIFLEPSYYKQFKKGHYTGYIEFALNYQGKQSFFNKNFSFVVQ